MERRTRGSQALLVEASRRDAAQGGQVMGCSERMVDELPDLGDLVVVLLAGTLAGLRDRLDSDGFTPAAELIADLVEITDHYLTSVAD
jgi:hypothetical protein